MRIEDIYMTEGDAKNSAQAFEFLSQSVASLNKGKGSKSDVDAAKKKLAGFVGDRQADLSLKSINNAWAEKTKK